MNVRFKSRCFHIVFVVIILLIIIFLANYFSTLTHTWVNNTQNSIIRRILTANDIQEVIAFNENTINVAKEYSLALLETTITSNDFPDFDKQIFLTIISSLPQSTKIEKFYFTTDKLIIDCMTKKPSDCITFLESLTKEGDFKEIVKSQLTTEDEEYHFSITIIF